MDLEEPIQSIDEEESSEIADAQSRSMTPQLQPQIHSTAYRDVQGDLESRQVSVIYGAFVKDRKSLRGIVLHHYHDLHDCIYAIRDERHTKSRSKHSHTVLAVIQEDKSASGSDKRYLVRYPDEKSKKNSERWALLNRSLEAEILARFRPAKVQHYVHATRCQTEPCNCTLQDPSLHDSGCLQLDLKRINDCKYGSGKQMKEPGRGYYWNEKNNHGSVWL